MGMPSTHIELFKVLLYSVRAALQNVKESVQLIDYAVKLVNSVVKIGLTPGGTYASLAIELW